MLGRTINLLRHAYASNRYAEMGDYFLLPEFHPEIAECKFKKIEYHVPCFVKEQ